MKKRALIVDGHAGCQLWQKAAVEAAGAEATVLSLRRRGRPAEFPLTAAERRIKNLMKFLWWRMPPRRRWSRMNGELLAMTCNKKDLDEVFGAADMLLGAYPPTVGQLLMDLAERYGKRVILNLAHRCTWEGDGRGRRPDTFAALLKQIHESDAHTLAAMGEYDYRYAAHYLGVKPVKLYTACHHMPLRRHAPVCDTVLVGPSRPAHRPGLDTGPFASTDEINARYQKWCAKNGRPKALRFGEIRKLYPHYELDDLAKHPAVVVFPYSAYSISMAELYEMNMPFFVPAAEVLLRHRMPRELFASPPPPPPRPGPHSSADSSATGAGSSAASSATVDHARAVGDWLRFCWFYRQENAVVWNSPDDLFRKLTEYDLAGLSEKMYLENQTRRAKS
ncbi:MAG: hypothetical protein OXU88_01930, partial [Gammaproteobacteria bacterium]|nr:hypothetical protein [Gammaproteobacteria bacterium]